MNNSARFFLSLLLVLAGITAAPAWAMDNVAGIPVQQPRVWRIGIVTDGSTPADKALAELFMKNIRMVAESDARVRFADRWILSGNDSRQGVRNALNRLFASPDVDIVIVLGVIGSTEVLERRNIPKPVIAPYIARFALHGRKKHGNASGIKNLVYIDSMYYLDEDIKTFKKLAHFNHLAVVLDRRVVNSFPNLDSLARDFGKKNGLKLDIVPAGSSAGEVLAALPEGTDAVMVGPLWHFDRQQFRQFAQDLVKRKIPGFSIWTAEQVEDGMFAGLENEGREDILARRTAIAFLDITDGIRPEAVVVKFVRSRHITINMATARAIGVYPSLLILTKARLINERQENVKRHINMKQAVDEAVEANLQLQSAATTVKAGEHSLKEAMSALLPRVDLETGARAIDEDRAKASGGASPERAWTGSVGGSVLLYSDKKWARYTAEEHLQEARKMNLDRVKLDVTYDASVAYLNVLRARTVERIYRENLKLTEANLARARVKVSTGAAGPDEVYRWETKFANDRSQLLYRESDTMDAMEALNRILHRPLQEKFIPEEATLKDPLFIMGDRFFFQLMENPWLLRKFRDFAAREAIELRPELKEYAAAIKAKERLRVSAKRQIWLPDFIVEWKVDHYLAQDGAGQRDSRLSDLDDTDWNVGVYARIPLFEGGKKVAEAARLQEEVARLNINQSAQAEVIVQQVLKAINRTRASYPSITLSRQAAEAAKRNLDLVTDSYVHGIKSIIDLLDAQNQSLSADLDAANAVYNFLIDFMGVQRAIGEFVTFMPEDAREKWLEKARAATDTTRH